jgi:hypothetical protein
VAWLLSECMFVFKVAINFLMLLTLWQGLLKNEDLFYATIIAYNICVNHLSAHSFTEDSLVELETHIDKYGASFFVVY